MTSWNEMKILVILLGGSLFGLPASALGAPNSQLALTLGFDYASGNYGTSQTSESYSTSLIIGYTPSERLDFSLGIPYLYQSSGSTVSLGGMRFPMQNSSGATGGSSGSGMGGMGGGSTTSSATNSQTGPGDVNLTAGYTLLTESASSPMLRPLAYIKAPTADKDKGLGTGAFDFGAGLSVGKLFGDLSVYGETLYVVPGSTAAYKPDNYMTYQASISDQLTQKLNTGLAISGASAAFAGNSAALEVQIKSSYRVTELQSVGAYLGQGLSNSSPDYMVGFYGALRF